MGSQVIQSSTLTSMADAIRSKTGGVSTLTPAQMISTIQNSWVVPGANDVVCATGPFGNNLNRMLIIKPLNNMVENAQYDYEIDIQTSLDTTTVGLFVSQAADDAVVWLSTTAGTRETLTGTFTCNYVSGYTPNDDPANAYIIVYQYPRTIDNYTFIYSIKIVPHSS